MEWTPLPIRVENFEEIITKGYYYVYKTLLIKDLIDLRGKLLLQLLQRILFILGIDQRDMLIRDDKMRKQVMRSSAACAPDAKDTDNDERIDLSDIKAPGVIRVTMKAATMRAMGTR